MKKIVSIIVAVAMLCSILVVPTMAASTVTKSYINDASGNAIGNQTTKKSVTGIAGKAANDVSTFVTRVRPQAEIDGNNTGNHKFQFSTNVNDFGDLVVFEASLYAPANLRTLYLTGNGGVNISKALNVDSALAPGWNRIVYVYDHSTAGSAKDELAGSYAIYLNGECINEFGANRQKVSNPIHNGNQITQLRFMVEDIDPNKEISLYVDDAECYAVTTDDKQAFLDSFEVGKPAVDSSSKYTIDGNKLVIDGTATVADVTAGSDTVRVYNKGNLVTDTATVLKHGFDIVVEDSANKIYSYYDVYEKGIVALADDVFSFNSAGFEFGGASSTVAGASGLYEKADNDESIKITEAGVGNKYMYIYQHFDEELYLVDGQRREDYIVVDVNVRNVDYASGGFMRFAMSTNQTPLVSDTKFSTFNANGWTNLRLVYSAPEGENYKYVDWADNIPDTTEDPNIIGKAIGHSVLYVNGVKKSEQDIKVTASDKNATGTNFTFGLNDLLLQFYDGDTANKRSVYVDDLKIYTSETDPGAPSAVELTAGSKYTVDNSAKNITFTEPITLSDIKTANSGVELVAFSDGAYTTQLADNTTLEHGVVVTAKAENGMYSTYTVADATLIFKQTNAAGFTKKHSATYSDATEEIAGKSGDSVKIARGAGLTQQTYIELDYGKLMSYETPEYVVLEMNYLPASKYDGFAISGQQGSSLTADFDGNLVTGQWNNIVVIYTNGSTEDNPTPGGTRYTAADPTATTTATDSKSAAIKASPHSYEVYVNGNLAVSGGAGSSVFGMNWENKSYNKDSGAISTTNRVEQYFRILAPIDSKYGEYTAYIDDVVLREVNAIDVAALTAMPELPAVEGLNVVGSSIELISDVAIDALPEGVTVYTDATCTTKVTEGNLENGYEVAYTDGKDVSYYTIELPADKVFADYPEYNSKWANISNGTTAATTGIDGDENGAYLVYSTSRTGEKPQHNAFYGLGTYTAGFFGERPYSIFSVDFKLGADFDHMFFGSNQHTAISSAVTYNDPRLVDGWNNFVCVVDYETNKSITYVNGIPSTPITSMVGKDLKYNSIRLVVYDRGAEEGNANDATVPVATLDNIKVYASVTNPFAAPLTYEATAENVTFTACDYIKNGYDYVAIAAAFDANNNLVGNVAIGTDTVTIAKNAGATYYMGYIWNSTTGLIPVTAAVRAE